MRPPACSVGESTALHPKPLTFFPYRGTAEELVLFYGASGSALSGRGAGTELGRDRAYSIDLSAHKIAFCAGALVKVIVRSSAP